MELVRDFVRDLVGIIFPGGLLVIFALWLIFSIMIIVVPLASLNVFAIADNSIHIICNKNNFEKDSNSILDLSAE